MSEMSDAELEARACRVVADVLGVAADQVTLATSHESVEEWDSMAMINLVMALEAEFGVTLGVDDAAKLVSVRAVIETVKAAGGK